jgi:HEAT repeat protein
MCRYPPRPLLIPAFITIALSGCSNVESPHSGSKPVSHWLSGLKNSDPKARKTSVAKLGNIGAADRAIVPTLVQMLTDADPGVRRESILALVKLNAQAPEATAVLKELASSDSDPQVRSYAAKALAKLRRNSA